MGRGCELTASICHCDVRWAPRQAAAAGDPVLLPPLLTHLLLWTQVQTAASGRSVPGVRRSGGFYPGSFGAICCCPVDLGP